MGVNLWKCVHKIRKCYIVANEKTIRHSSNEVNMSNYRKPFCLQPWKQPIPYTCSNYKTRPVNLYKKNLQKKKIWHMKQRQPLD